MEVDHSHLPLGKKAAVHDPRVPKMARFMTAAPAFPADCAGAAGKVTWGVMANDRLGCCTIAGIGHKIQADSVLVRDLFSASDDQIVAMYEKWDGYDPKQPSTDQGGIESEVLSKWYAQGFYGRHVVAYGYVDHKNHDQVRHLIAELNGLYIGVALPLSAQREKVWGASWDGISDQSPGSWGGHCVYVYGYTSNPDGSLKTIRFVSWGQEMEMTAAFWDTYVDEAWAILLGAWIKGGKSPAGLDVAALEAEVRQLRSEP